jgi:hypothetical protein
MEILRIVSHEKLGVNQIWNLSSYKFKTSVTDMIEQLEKARLVKREKTDKRPQNGKRQFISLTNIGSEFLDLYDHITPLFQKHFDVFLKDFYEFNSYYDKINDKPFQNTLKSRGWKDEDIYNYKYNYDNLFLFFRIFQYNLLQFLSLRYSILLSRIKPGKVTQLLTMNLLVTFIEEYNKNIQKIFPLYIEEEKDNINSDQKHYDLYEDLTSNGLSIFYGERWSFPNSMFDTIEELMMSLLSILNPPTELINKVVGHNKNINRDPVVKAFYNFLKKEKR